MPTQIPTLPYSEIEAAKLEAAIARRAMFQAQRLAVDLADGANEHAMAAIVAGAQARVQAEAANGPQGGADGADVVTLHPDQPDAAAA